MKLLNKSLTNDSLFCLKTIREEWVSLIETLFDQLIKS